MLQPLWRLSRKWSVSLSRKYPPDFVFFLVDEVRKPHLGLVQAIEPGQR